MTNRKIQKFFDIIYRNFINSLKYIKETKNYIWFCFLLFAVFALIGYFFPVFFKDFVIKLIKDLLKQTESLNGIELIRFIITNNIKSSFFGIVLGMFFGVFSIGMLIVNGYVVGFVASKTVAVQGILVLWRLLPHGIFEIPAVLISIGIGLRLGMSPFYIKNKQKGILSLLLAFFAFIVCFSFLMMIVVLLKNFGVFVNMGEISSENYADLLEDSFMQVIVFIITAFSYVFGIYCGLMVLGKQDRAFIIKMLKNSLIVFILVVIPLLVIAGIIEGSLIALMR